MKNSKSAVSSSSASSTGAVKPKRQIVFPTFLKKIIGFFFHPVTRLVLEGLIFVSLISLVFVGTIADLPFAKGHQFFVVLSGSMEPVLRTGSMILVNKSKAPVNKGDVITFFTPRTNRLTTHRVLNVTYDEKVKKNLYSTKGDANQDPDPWILTDENIVGRMRFTIPFAGYLVTFARTPKGFFLLAVLPGLLLIIDEIWKVKKVMQLEYEKKILSLKKELELSRSSAPKKEGNA